MVRRRNPPKSGHIEARSRHAFRIRNTPMWRELPVEGRKMGIISCGLCFHRVDHEQAARGVFRRGGLIG